MLSRPMRDEVHLWLGPTRAALHRRPMPGVPSVASRAVPADRRRAAALKSSNESARFLQIRAFVRHVLSHYGAVRPQDLQIRIDRLGRPYLLGASPPAFSISHCGELVVCAVASCGARIGIDIEAIPGKNTNARGLAQRFFTADEAGSLDGMSAAQASRAFSNLWTLREAYLKARGIGITVPLKALSFANYGAEVEANLAGVADASTGWSFFTRYQKRYALALALAGHGAPPIRLRTFGADRTEGIRWFRLFGLHASVMPPRPSN